MSELVWQCAVAWFTSEKQQAWQRLHEPQPLDTKVCLVGKAAASPCQDSSVPEASKPFSSIIQPQPYGSNPARQLTVQAAFHGHARHPACLWQLFVTSTYPRIGAPLRLQRLPADNEELNRTNCMINWMLVSYVCCLALGWGFLALDWGIHEAQGHPKQEPWINDAVGHVCISSCLSALSKTLTRRCSLLVNVATMVALFNLVI